MIFIIQVGISRFSMEDLQNNLIRNIDFIKQADTKASYLSALLTAVVGFAVSNLNTADWSKWWDIILASVSLLAVIISIFFIARVIFPTLKEKLSKQSLIYYGTISTMDIEAYKNKRNKLSKKEENDYIMDQVYITSVIVNIKMKNVQRAFVSVLFSVALLMVFIGSSLL